MTSAEKILAGIIESAKKSAEEIIRKAKLQAESVIKDATTKAEAMGAKIISAAEEKASIIKETGKSGASLIIRDASLSCRIEQIDALIEKTAEKILSMPDEEYFDFLYRIIEKNNLKSGVLMLANNDSKRNITVFKTKLSETAIEISEKYADIRGGFILKQGDIEINAAIDALIHEKRYALVDAINNIISKG